ncbi:CRISPR-associated helicase Cas3' [Clostridium sp. D2Q-11]|uniref:CRISPR-associated helicase Cas3 n=1 Tax=Anaeromonas frigoriresistens TaxID=2683708 RepID=A0A942UQ06_9FIRM|nr:CRISPR-associated helicase Cas3' [Anaeromonas frigoriresistens]MBS4537078.1 CRISPR-associated helicase Cas3' [Anaeromonas frigoriresistens]
MNNYLAKSNPKETIQEHTDNLLKNYNILKSTYPSLEINWDMLYKVCLIHDLGKMNLKFQDKIEDRARHKEEIPHGILSLAFIDKNYLIKEEGYSKNDIKIIAHAIALHHERELNYTMEELKKEVELIKKESLDFKYDKLEHISVRMLSQRYFAKDTINERENEKLFYEYVLIKGLLNRIDYAASGYIDVEKENDFLLDRLKNVMKKWQKKDENSKWNDLQKHMLNNRDENIIAIAETGMGKTEAGLLWIGNNKGFFTLPLKTAINAMYNRITKDIVYDNYEDKVGMLHSDAYDQYLNRSTESKDIDEYYNKTKQLSLPLTICTLDQIFDFVFRYRGFEPKLATLSYSKIVIDEIQMYSPDLIAYLIVGLKYITKVGGKFAILTATLPNIVVDLLKKENVEFIEPKTFTKENRVRHSIKVIKNRIKSEYVNNLYNRNKVLVICNTVKEAQRVYMELKEEFEIENINLFHSNFIKKDRKLKEDHILRVGDKDNNEYGIWVTTQVVEASLDIDFDILVTELSDLNGLFQRMGRCYRNRSFDNIGYNCYVFDGGEKKNTGVGYVIDEDIYKLSKKALQSFDGIIKEEEKMKLIKKLYNTETLKDTDYYSKIIENIEYIRMIEDYEKSKNEVKQIFRNINNITVIPEDVYYENKEEIMGCIEMISSKHDKSSSIESIKKYKTQKRIARNKLQEYTASVPYHRINNNIEQYLEISRYQKIPIFNCEYSFEFGIKYIKSENTEVQLEDRFF